MYDYFFYKYYKFLKEELRNDIAAFSAIVALCWLNLFIFLSIYVLFYENLVGIVDLFDKKMNMVVFVIIILLSNFWYFNLKRMKISIRKYYNESLLYSIIGYILVLSIFCLSMYIFMNYTVDEIFMIGRRERILN